MELAIVTICYNGYGEFAKRWVEHVLECDPAEVVIYAMGSDHGIPKDFDDYAGRVKVIYNDEVLPMGTARNRAIEGTKSEWILYFSIDDVLLGSAKAQIAEKSRSDLVMLGFSVLCGDKKKDYRVHVPSGKTIREWEYYFRIPGYVAFRRLVWEKNPYVDTEYPNMPFIIENWKNGFHYDKTDGECALYIKWDASHSALRDENSRCEASEFISSYV